MRQTTATQFITSLSSTNDDAVCVASSYAVTGDFFVIEQVGDFSFVAPFSIK
jgi:hypothetical protein